MSLLSNLSCTANVKKSFYRYAVEKFYFPASCDKKNPLFRQTVIKNLFSRQAVIKKSSFQASCDRNLTALRDDLATDLFELEEEYYSSSYK